MQGPASVETPEEGPVNRTVEFLKTTLVGGAPVVLPVWLTVLLLLKAVMQLQIFVKPVSTALPEGVVHPRVMALLVLLALCFLVGAAIRTAVGRQVRMAVERNLLERLPGYTTLRNFTQQLGDMENAKGFQPALVEIEDALVPGFLVEENGPDKCTVFLPSAPTPAAGSIYIIDRARVHPVDVPITTAFKCVTRWGTGAGELLAAMQPARV
jgi:uncharacterized membrane protein